MIEALLAPGSQPFAVALRYRAQRPMVDALLKEVGLGDLEDLSGLVGGQEMPAPSAPRSNGSDRATNPTTAS